MEEYVVPLRRFWVASSDCRKPSAHGRVWLRVVEREAEDTVKSRRRLFAVICGYECQRFVCAFVPS